MGSEDTQRISAEKFEQYIQRRAAVRGSAPIGFVSPRAATTLVAPGWQWFYAMGKDPTDPAVLPRYQAGVLAYKKALITNGFGDGIKLDIKLWGNMAKARTIDFQKSVGLTADGVLGPATAKKLCRKYVLQWEAHYALPDHVLGKQGTLESNNHAVAEGFVDPDDEGWSQVHMPFHPEISLAQAWDLEFAIKWTAGQLWSNKSNLGDIDAALAAYNVGYFTAKQWLAAGKPSSGGPIWHTQWGDVDSWARAFEYVQVVRGVSY